ncbi:gamma-crystallin N [Pteropus alecto]|uniref:gamma-crystallin N n=1 Tax=Pteropus alecto TaxID=9402 RepID=UPI000D53BCD4|nr:gamma-crystallin N [Pteropus alecto]
MQAAIRFKASSSGLGRGCRGPRRLPLERSGEKPVTPHPPSRPSQITLYEGKHFTGRKLEVFGDCENFQDRGFMNRVNSIRVESGSWVCFGHPDFRGQQFVLEHGDYPDFFRWNGHNDHMGSCRPVGMHGEHFRLEIFEGCNFTGQCLEFQEDCPLLQSRGWAKSCVNAIKVYGDGA